MVSGLGEWFADESIWKDLYPFHFVESREHKAICEQAINDPRSGGGCRD